MEGTKKEDKKVRYKIDYKWEQGRCTGKYVIVCIGVAEVAKSSTVLLGYP